MKEMYNNYKSDLSKKNNLVILIIVIFIIGIIFGSIYITILSSSQKENINNYTSTFFSNISKINFNNKIDIFKNALYSNLIYTIIMWLLGLSIIGIPIIFIMVFFKSFVLSFSISSIFAKYGLKGILKALIYLLPSSLIFCIFTIFLASYSILISNKLLKSAFKKETINFKTFMGRYSFILVIGILISILCALYEGFIEPYIYSLV